MGILTNTITTELQGWGSLYISGQAFSLYAYTHLNAKTGVAIPQKCALSKIEYEDIFIFQAGLHILL